MSDSRARLVVLTLVATLFAAGLVPFAAPQAAAAPPGAVGLSDAWAYGTQRGFNLTITTPNGVHTISAVLAWYTTFARTNVSDQVAELSVNRTVSSNFSSEYCSPDCAAPHVAVHLTHTAYLTVAGTVSVTRAGTVYEDGVAVPAFALLNTSAEASAQLRSTAEVAVATPQGPRQTVATFDAYGVASADLAFAPPLGLIPLDLAVGDTWNATSAYAGAGAWSVDWSYAKTNASGTSVLLSGDPSGTLNATGPVSVTGVALPALTLPNGSVLPSVALSFDGDLLALDGFLLLPGGFGILAGGVGPWAGYQMGFAELATHQLAIEYEGSGPAFRLRAASAFFATNDSSEGMGAAAMAGPGGPMDGAGNRPAGLGGSPGVPTTEVVATPLAVADAQDAAACLPEAPCAAPTPGASGGTSEFVTAVVVGGAVAGVALAATWVVLRTRRRGP